MNETLLHDQQHFKAYELLLPFFDNHIGLVSIWLTTPNEGLDNVEPMSLIRSNQGQQLLDFIEWSLIEEYNDE